MPVSEAVTISTVTTVAIRIAVTIAKIGKTKSDSETKLAFLSDQFVLLFISHDGRDQEHDHQQPKQHLLTMRVIHMGYY